MSTESIGPWGSLEKTAHRETSLSNLITMQWRRRSWKNNDPCPRWHTRVTQFRSSQICPSTIQRRRTLKPILSVLTQKDKKYRWAFPFAVKVSNKAKNYSFSNFSDGEKLLLHLKFISQEADMDTFNNVSGSAKRPTPTYPQSPLWNKAKTKKAKDNGPPWTFANYSGFCFSPDPEFSSWFYWTYWLEIQLSCFPDDFTSPTSTWPK